MCFVNSRKLSKLVENAPKQRLDYFDLYNLKLNDIAMNLYVSRKRATKATHIHCTESGDIVWEQFYPFGGMSRPAREKKYVLKPVCDKKSATIVVIRGNPGDIIGLDNGIFKSHLSVPEMKHVYLMTECDISRFLSKI